MKKYRINIKPTAEADLEKRYLQIAEESPQNAVQWYLGIIEAIEKLDSLAERCPIAPEDVDIQRGIRHLILGHYRVLYTINNDVIEVLHVRHGRMAVFLIPSQSFAASTPKTPNLDCIVIWVPTV